MEEIDIKKLERCYFQTDADFRSANYRIDQLREENMHLREVIHDLLLTIRSFGNIKVDNNA